MLIDIVWYFSNAFRFCFLFCLLACFLIKLVLLWTDTDDKAGWTKARISLQEVTYKWIQIMIAGTYRDCCSLFLASRY